LLVWHGVVFVREGPYKDGIFKFQMNIPPSYPAKAPEVSFISKVYHPLVDLKSGKLDISVKNRKI
jgi:ubiquitin-protein ligase